MSTLFARTLRDDPADADVLSHRLLHRAGYIRRVATGGFAWLPLGWAVLQNVERVVREEMVRAGFQEVHLPALLPREPFDTSGRWDEYGEGLFRLVDRRGNDHLLAPTHEEIFTLLVKDLYSSYKDLPLTIFQIQTKFRDELRSRGGLLRGREFVMKDSYSFDLDDDGLQESYAAHRAAYERIFDRLGLPYVIVSAVSGAMGGSVSEEFLCPMEVGEDTFVRCTSCDYAANTEAVQTPAPEPVPVDGAPASHVEETPDTQTIDALVAHLNARSDLARPDRAWEASDLLKNVVVRLRHPDGETEAIAIGVPGDRSIDVRRLESQVAPAVVEEFEREDFERHPSLVRGYIGPGVLGAEGESGIRYLVDPRVAPGTRWVTGADKPGHHVVDLAYGRDFVADGTIEASEVREGDPCPRCGHALEIARGIEIGHIFQLGQRYAKAFDLTVQGPDGKPVTVTMGSYGIGISRVVAAIAETTADELGLCWPAGIGPADVHIVVAGPSDEHATAAISLAESLEAVGVRVLVDDRKASPGIKFADAELIGVPTIIVVGRGLASGQVEFRERAAGTNVDVDLDSVVDLAAAQLQRPS